MGIALTTVHVLQTSFSTADAYVFESSTFTKAPGNMKTLAEADMKLWPSLACVVMSGDGLEAYINGQWVPVASADRNPAVAFASIPNYKSRPWLLLTNVADGCVTLNPLRFNNYVRSMSDIAPVVAGSMNKLHQVISRGANFKGVAPRVLMKPSELRQVVNTPYVGDSTFGAFGLRDVTTGHYTQENLDVVNAGRLGHRSSPISNAIVRNANKSLVSWQA